MSSILTLPPEEVEAMLSGDALEVRCDACGRQYRVEVDELRDFRDAGGRRGVSKTDDAS